MPSRALRLALPALLLGALVSCDGGSPTEPSPAPCTYSLSRTSLSFGASGGSEAITVTTQSQCTWTAASDRAWMTISSGGSGTGPGSVNVSVAANSASASRGGTLTIAGQAVSVQEEGVAVACTIDISPASASYNKDAATGTFGVAAPDGCAWTAASGAAWLTVTSGTQGTGNGTVAYAIERNRDTAGRSATIAVGDRTFAVTQAGDTGACTYGVTPVTFNPCMSAQTMTATVTTEEGCAWTASPDASWITITGGQSGDRSGVITFRVSDNWAPPRHGVVMVRWPTLTAGQNLHVYQAGCYYAVSTATIAIPAGGGTGRFDVIQFAEPNICGGATQDRCVWTAQSSVSWITITTSMPQAGDDPVNFSVAPNTSSAARTGTITVQDKVVQITQAGQ